MPVALLSDIVIISIIMIITLMIYCDMKFLLSPIPIENIDILHIAIYCNILLDIVQYCVRYCVVFSRLKNKITNKCIKIIIKACL